jgi:RNA polymerase sigma-70 factor (ECF subfamily)
MGPDTPAPDSDGDRESLEREVASLRTYLLKVANGLGGGPRWCGVNPSDIVQEALKSALVDIRKGKFRARGAGSLRAWLRCILVSKYRDAARAAARAGKPEPVTDVPDGGPSPSEEYADREQEALRRRALDALPPRDRQVLIWRQDEDLTFEEIGRRLGISVKGASKAFYRAGQRLRDAYQGLAGPCPANGRGT